MNCFYLYIFILISFIIAVSCYNTYITSYIEAFNTNTQTFILLGDSILKNDAYVADGKSVDDLLQERHSGKSLCLAENNSTIADTYSQINSIPLDLDTPDTTIFLSVGGNDILIYHINNDTTNDTTNDTSILKPMCSSYKKLVKAIRTRLPSANIVLVDIYYPDNLNLNQYHPMINEWNAFLYSYAKKQNYNVLKISKVLTKSDDFSFGIEPSSTGSNKIVDIILSNN